MARDQTATGTIVGDGNPLNGVQLKCSDANDP
jgi:hypothetical protein